MTSGVDERDAAESRNTHFIDIDNNSIRESTSLRSLGSTVDLSHSPIDLSDLDPQFLTSINGCIDLVTSFVHFLNFQFSSLHCYILLHRTTSTWVLRLYGYNQVMGRLFLGKEVGLMYLSPLLFDLPRIL